MEIPQALVLTPTLPAPSHLNCFHVKLFLQASFKSINSSKISFITDDSDGEPTGISSDTNAAINKSFKLLPRETISSGQLSKC